VTPVCGILGAVDAIENPRTAEQVEFIGETEAVLTMISTWTRPGHRASEHVHPTMEERYEVLAGEAAFRVDGVEIRVPPGGVVVVPPGRRHLAWNPTEEPVRLRVEMRPPLRWREFTIRFFAGEDPIALLADFADEVRLCDREG
jgi:mannose-6-phosphate isomerase-like protein (cupin superfamily)